MEYDDKQALHREAVPQKFTYIVTVEAEHKEEADFAIVDRLGIEGPTTPDSMYYKLEWELPTTLNLGTTMIEGRLDTSA